MKKNILLLFFCFLPVLLIFAQEAKKNVFVLDIDDAIDPRMNRYVKIALEEASNINADLVIIKMNTYGGAVTDADEIRTRILEFSKPIYVFINKNAASAGALISIACDSIYMAEGASIGAATVVNGNDRQAAPDKYQSYMRGMMRSTATAKGRDPKIAEAMVDQNIEIKGITEAGQVITFSTTEAIQYDFCEAKANSIEEILTLNKINNYSITYYEISVIDKIIAFFLNPFISGILILVIVGGLYFELQTPGVGFPLFASITAIILYLIPHYLYGLAAYWEIALLIIGITLIIIEIFFIPGFGIAGISGILITILSFIFIMLKNDFFDFSLVPDTEIIKASITTMAAMLLSTVLIIIGGINLSKSKAFNKIALTKTLGSKEGYTANFNKEKMIGKKGKTYTVLRPSGKVMIETELYDAYTRGEFIDQDVEVIVIEEEGSTLKVRKVT